MQAILQHDVIFFDLDYTLIDSSARYKACIDENRTLDVEKYRQTQTHEKIMRDTLTPLVRVYRQAQQKGKKLYCITARDMNENDYHFLTKNGLLFQRIFSRDSIVKHKARDGVGDGLYKRQILKPLLNLQGFKTKSIAIIDDNDSVLHHANDIGITGYNSLKLLEKHFPQYKFKAGI